MIIKENKHAVRIREQEVVSHRHIDIEQSLSLSVIRNIRIDECIRNDEGKVEVHYRSKVAVDRAESRILLPPGRETAAYRIPGLTCNIELRIFLHCSLAPLSCELSIHIRMCILTDTVDTCILDPPGRGLDKIIAYKRIFLIEVRHSIIEPSVCKELSL